MDNIINRSVKIDARSKEKMIGHTQRFGDFASSMRLLSGHKKEIIKLIKGEVDEQTKRELDLFCQKDGKIRVTSKVGEKYFGKFEEFIEGKMREKSVLDVGCSKPNPRLIEKWKTYVGIDLYENEFSGIMNQLNNGSLLGAEATYLPFKNGGFDYAIAYSVIPMLGVNAYFGIKELARVSREGIAFTVWHEDSIDAWIAKRNDDREIMGYESRTMYVVEFDYCKGIFVDRQDNNSLSIESSVIYFNEKKMRKFLEELDFGEIKIFTNRYTIIEKGKQDRTVNGTMEIVALKRAQE